MNKIEILGRLVANIEMKEGKNVKYGKFTIAVPRKNDKETVDFVNCVAFGKIAEAIEKYTEKGNRLLVEGSLQLDKYQDKDGNTKTSITIIVNDFYFIDFKRKEQQETIPNI